MQASSACKPTISIFIRCTGRSVRRTASVSLATRNESAPAVTLLETLEALTECQRTGKIRYIGVSNETAFGVMRYLHLADKHDLPRIVTIQNPYSLLNRSYEVGLAEVTQYEEVELLAYSCGLRYPDGQIPERRETGWRA